MEVGLVVAIVFVGALVRATFGFGEAVVSMPLLALLPISLHTAIALIGLAGLTVAILAVATGWRHVDRAAMARLVPATVVGVPVGLLLVAYAPAELVTGLLGGCLIGYGAYSLARPAFRALEHPQWALLFGFGAGALGAAYNFNGVPVAVYAGLRGCGPQPLPGDAAGALPRLRGGHRDRAGAGGPVEPGGWTDYGLALPTIIGATVLGTALHRRIPAERFARYVYLLVIALGVVSLVRAL